MRKPCALFLATVLLGATPLRSSLISIDARNATLADVIALIARQSGANIVTDDSVRTRRVTMRLVGVRYRDALDLIAAASGLSIIEDGGVLLVGSPDILRRTTGRSWTTAMLRLVHAGANDVAKALLAALPPGSVVLPDERTNSVLLSIDTDLLERARTLVESLDIATPTLPGRSRSIAYDLRYTRAEDVLKELKVLLPAAALVADDQGNAIVVTGSEADQDAARSAIAGIDRPGPQVLFEVRVADVTPQNDSSDVGLEFGGLDLQGQPLTGAMTYVFSGTTAALNVRLNALITSGHAQILATPRLVTLNGKEADLLIGETYPVVYSTSALGGTNVQFVDIGVKLRLTPIIGLDGSVTAELHPEYSELQGFTSSGYPIIANRRIDSTLRVRSGETIILGGLLRDVSSETIERVPWLSQVPILGKLFQDRQTTHERDEIVFLITPRVIDDGAPPSR